MTVGISCLRFYILDTKPNQWEAYFRKGPRPLKRQPVICVGVGCERLNKRLGKEAQPAAAECQGVLPVPSVQLAHSLALNVSGLGKPVQTGSKHF